MSKFIDATDVAFTSGAKVGAFKGAVKNLKNQTYHGLKAYWSSTQLKYLHSKSGAHFEDKYIGHGEPTKATAAMIMGSLVHCMVLTPDEFSDEFFVMPDMNFRTKEGKAHKEELLANNPGKYAVTDEQIAMAERMRASVYDNPKAKELLEPMKKEYAFFWTCPFSQLNFKAKIDGAGATHFIELKTTIDAGPEAFKRHAYNMNYDLSVIHYRQGLANVMGVEPKCYFIVVESKPPHVCQVYEVGDTLLETGHEKWLDAVQKLERGMKEKYWPGYSPVEDVPLLEAPPWALKKAEEFGALETDSFIEGEL
jgi:exodeoxyribonuclease VIII